MAEYRILSISTAIFIIKEWKNLSDVGQFKEAIVFERQDIGF